jgi:general secretion pathway protein N
VLRLVPGFGRLRIELVAEAGAGAAGGPEAGGAVIGQWPASWLVGLGTPWNTLQPSGSLALSSRGLAVESAGGRWQLSGSAVLELNNMASRISTLDVLGSYRLTVSGGGASGAPANVQLTTSGGALQLSGSGQLLGPDASSALRFRGSASAAPGNEAVLNNLLNIIGRRQGATAVIAIG